MPTALSHAQLVFMAAGSVRYHACRAEYFRSLARWISILNGFLGAGVVVSALSSRPQVATAAGLLIAFTNAYVLFTKPDEEARRHEKWHHDWGRLKADVMSTDTPTERELQAWRRKAGLLNAEVTEDMKVVKAQVYNDTMSELGRKGVPYRINWWLRATKHVMIHAHAFDRQNLESSTISFDKEMPGKA